MRRRDSCMVCRWCQDVGFKKDMFVVRNGPQDTWFCDATCVGEWVDHRHKPEVRRVLRMSAWERASFLNGVSMTSFAESLSDQS